MGYAGGEPGFVCLFRRATAAGNSFRTVAPFIDATAPLANRISGSLARRICRADVHARVAVAAVGAALASSHMLLPTHVSSNRMSVP